MSQNLTERARVLGGLEGARPARSLRLIHYGRRLFHFLERPTGNCFMPDGPLHFCGHWSNTRARCRESIPQSGQFRHTPADVFQELPTFVSTTPDEFRTG